MKAPTETRRPWVWFALLWVGGAAGMLALAGLARVVIHALR